MQGLALAVIVGRVFQLLDQRFNVELMVAYGELTVVFVALIAVYFSYVWFQVYARWAPRLSDTAIPFALGVLESAAAISAGRGIAWVWWFGVFQISGVMALVHTSARLRPADTGGAAFQAIQSLLGRLRLVILANIVVTAYALALSVRFWTVDAAIWVVMISSITTSALYLGLSDRSVARLFRRSLRRRVRPLARRASGVAAGGRMRAR